MMVTPVFLISCGQPALRRSYTVLHIDSGDVEIISGRKVTLMLLVPSLELVEVM